MNKISNYLSSSNLYADPNFLVGMGRLLDFSGLSDEYNTSPNGELADYFAIEQDFRMIGNDISDAFLNFKN